MHPEAGNYNSIKHPQFKFEEGERVDFFCPLCLSHLDAAIDENLVHVIMVDRLGREHEVYFSRIADENSTYKISDDGVMVTGVHSYRYTQLKVPDKPLPYLPN